MSKKTSVLIGCGAIAREHLAVLARLDVDILGVCDLSAARAEATAERFRVAKWYIDYQTMLTETKPDLVHITTPPSSHFQIAKNCLSAGLNVLCEKPITVEYRDFLHLRQLAEHNRCILIENQNLRFHSSIRRINDLLSRGEFGDLLDVQIAFSLNLLGKDSPYIDPNAPHFGVTLRGGVIGDFLPHIAYLASMYVGPVIDLRTIWMKRSNAAVPFADEFRGFIKGERASATVSFSANSLIAGYWIRVVGTKMYAETNLLDPPRIAFRRHRGGEQALANLKDGVVEAYDVFKGTLAAFSRKLGGTSSYDGLQEMFVRIYAALERQEAQPLSLDDIDATARLVDQFTSSDRSL